MEQKFISGYKQEVREAWSNPENLKPTTNPSVLRVREMRRLDKEAHVELEELEKIMPAYVQEMREKYQRKEPFSDLKLLYRIHQDMMRTGGAYGEEE